MQLPYRAVAKIKWNNAGEVPKTQKAINTSQLAISNNTV